MAAAQPLPSLEILVRDQDGISIWSGPPFDNGEPVTKMQKVACESAVFCENGSRLMMVKSEGAISVFDCKTCNEIRTIQVQDLLDAVLSPCGTYVQTFKKTSSPREHNVNLWEVETGDSVYSLSQKHMTTSNWPTISFSSDEAVACRLVTNEVQFFDTGDFSIGYVSHIRVPRVASVQISKQPSSHIATYAPEVKGVPASVQIYACGSGASSPSQPLAQRSFFGCSTVKFHWNYGSTGLLFVTQSDVDETNQGCDGESKLNYLTTDGIHEGVVPLRQEGPIHDVQWSYSGSNFAVVYGIMPAKAMVFDKNCTPILDLGEGPYNTIKWNPNGRVLCLAGFGNLLGDMAFWDCNKKKQVRTATAEGSVTSEWSPNGCYFMTASTAPDRQVDNRIKIFHPDGSLFFEKVFDKLFQADWKPESAERFGEISGLGDSLTSAVNEGETDINGIYQQMLLTHYQEMSLKLQEIVALFKNHHQENSYCKVLDRFISHSPPTYNGVCDLVILEEWVGEMEKLFEATRCPEEHMIRLATLYLKGNAKNWWVMMEKDMLSRHGYNWDQFKGSLKSWFYPEPLRWQKEEEFLNLKQGEMSVQEYACKFLELGRFAPHIFENEALRIEWFERKLNPEIRCMLQQTTSHTIQKAYEKALDVYESLQTRDNKRSYESAISPSQDSPVAKRPNVDHDDDIYDDHNSDTPQEQSECYMECSKCKLEVHPGKQCDGRPFSNGAQVGRRPAGGSTCPRCNLCHPGTDCRGRRIKCFECGMLGHRAANCYSRQADSGPSRRNRFGAQSGQGRGGSGFREGFPGRGGFQDVRGFQANAVPGLIQASVAQTGSGVGASSSK